MDRAERWIVRLNGGPGLEVAAGELRPARRGNPRLLPRGGGSRGVRLGCCIRATRWPASPGFSAGCRRLKHEGGPAVLEGLRALAITGSEARQARSEVVRYFANQAHRMDYPSYLAKGWAIGSGPVESACKTVIGQRMKGAGMRWGRDGADAVSA